MYCDYGVFPIPGTMRLLFSMAKTRNITTPHKFELRDTDSNMVTNSGGIIIYL